MSKNIDAAFLAMPYEPLASNALAEVSSLGAKYGDFRFERLKGQSIALRDIQVERVSNSDSVGYAVRVIYHGSWGFASGFDLTPAAV
ncbi:MAG TPA: DNA gyrase modulator, partial [Candidatus Saccharimonadia bacterium]|nr:DNA gyrase modulator [Candidatus Saccharimonadia bacterium]